MDYRSRRAVHAGDDDKPTDRAAFSYQPSLLNEVGALGFPIVSLRTRFLGALTRTGFFTLFIPAPSIPRYRLAEQEEERKLYSGPDCAGGGRVIMWVGEWPGVGRVVSANARAYAALDGAAVLLGAGAEDAPTRARPQGNGWPVSASRNI